MLAPDPKATADDLWQTAADADAGKAVRAAVGLLATDAGRAVLREKLLPARSDVTDAQIQQWVADLGSDSFRTREAASKELTARARLAAPAVRDALRASPELEVRRRLEAVLARLDRPPSPDELRAARVVRAAELVGTAEVRDLLTAWSRGAAGAVLTEDAKAALARLGNPPPR